MIVIGGCIGIGLFVIFGGVIYDVGVLGVLIGYVIIGIMVFFLMMLFGEMVMYLLVLGLFSIYVIRFVDLFLGFVFGWNYWFNWVVIVVVDIMIVV